MFTGIITHLGKLNKIQNHRFTFHADKSICNKMTKGTSISVNGVCLTVEDIPSDNSFSVTLIPETLQRTMLGSLQKNDLVNLELPMTPENFLAGHIVQGHIDDTAEISEIKTQGNSKLFKITVSSKLSKYIVEKGSIAINGISLTVIQSEKNYFTVGIIPYTWTHTMLHQTKVGDKVNIETDILAKYLEKLTKK